jgi:hypothetical protein
VQISQFQDPHFVESLTEQYLLAKQSSAASTTAAPSLDALAIRATGLIA